MEKKIITRPYLTKRILETLYWKTDSLMHDLYHGNFAFGESAPPEYSLEATVKVYVRQILKDLEIETVAETTASLINDDITSIG